MPPVFRGRGHDPFKAVPKRGYVNALRYPLPQSRPSILRLCKSQADRHLTSSDAKGCLYRVPAAAVVTSELGRQALEQSLLK